MKFTLESIVVASQDLTVADLEGEAVVLDVSTGQYYGMNATGVFILTKLQEPMSCRDLVGVMVKEYDVDADQCWNDVQGFLAELRSKGLVHRSSQVSA